MTPGLNYYNEEERTRRAKIIDRMTLYTYIYKVSLQGVPRGLAQELNKTAQHLTQEASTCQHTGNGTRAQTLMTIYL